MSQLCAGNTAAATWFAPTTSPGVQIPGPVSLDGGNTAAETYFAGQVTANATATTTGSPVCVSGVEQP